MSENVLLDQQRVQALSLFESEHIEVRDGVRSFVKKSSLPYLKALLAKYGYSSVILSVYDEKCKKTIETILHAEQHEQLELQRIGVLEHIDFSASVARLVENQEENESTELPPNVVSIFKKK